MNSCALISAVMLMAFGALPAAAQDKPADVRPATQLTAQTAASDARDVVEAYVAAALAGKVAEAAALAKSGTPPESRQRIEQFPRVLKGVSVLVVPTVLADDEQGAALAVSDQVKLAEPEPDGQDTGRFVFSLTRSEGDWRISDIDVESEAGAAKEVARFRTSYPDAKKSDAGEPSGELKVFKLVHADARLMSDILGQLFDDVRIAADQRSNTIIASGSHDDLAKIEALLLRLDKPHRHRPSDAPGEASGKSMLWQDARPLAPPQPATLREKYNQLEQQAARLAEQYRELSVKATPRPGHAQALKQQLTDVVNQAFEARQKLQRAELAELRQRLARIERQIAARERIKDAIIERRIEALLNPDLRWVPAEEKGAVPPTSAAAPPATKLDAHAQQLSDLAQSRWNLLMAQYRQGKAGPMELLAAANELLEARLGVAQSAAARQALLRDHVGMLKDLKRMVEAQYDVNNATQADVLMAHSALLKAERRLAAEKATPPTPIGEADAHGS